MRKKNVKMISKKFLKRTALMKYVLEEGKKFVETSHPMYDVNTQNRMSAIHFSRYNALLVQAYEKAKDIQKAYTALVKCKWEARRAYRENRKIFSYDTRDEFPDLQYLVENGLSSLKSIWQKALKEEALGYRFKEIEAQQEIEKNKSSQASR